MAKKTRKPNRPRDYLDDLDDGVIEKSAYSPLLDERVRKPVSRYIDHAQALAKSHWIEGMLVTCPDKTIISSSGRTHGTIVQLFGSEVLVLCGSGHIHRCYLSELGERE